MPAELVVLLMPFSFFGGIALLVRAAIKGKIELDLAERAKWQQAAAPAAATSQNDALLNELKALKQQINDMQSTSHQFDISFDAALSRLEGRVDRLETKGIAPQSATITAAASEPQEQRVGLR